MNSTLSRQIRKINELNTECYEKTVAIKDITDKYIASGDHSSITEERIKLVSDAYNKKARDTVVSLNRIYKDAVYDDYESDLDLFFRNASYVDSDVPPMVNYNSILNFSVKFRNDGVFWAWTADKGIKMTCAVTRSDGASYDTEEAILDTSLAVNTPGDEKTNQDYKRVKTFNISFTVDMPQGEYILTCKISDAQNRDYNCTFTSRIRVI